MKSFLRKTRFIGLACALALLAQPLATLIAPQNATSHAGVTIIAPPPTTVVTGGGGGGSTAGGIIVGGVFVSVASIMLCALIAGIEFDRELTAEEAALAGLIPLSCLLGFADEDDEDE